MCSPSINQAMESIGIFHQARPFALPSDAISGLGEVSVPHGFEAMLLVLGFYFSLYR